jgi:alpha-tubulin suppressor-like RCC1 family protein
MVDKKHRVYSIGNGGFGRLGHGDERDRARLTRI